MGASLVIRCVTIYRRLSSKGDPLYINNKMKCFSLKVSVSYRWRSVEKKTAYNVVEIIEALHSC